MHHELSREHRSICRGLCQRPISGQPAACHKLRWRLLRHKNVGTYCGKIRLSKHELLALTRYNVNSVWSFLMKRSCLHNHLSQTHVRYNEMTSHLCSHAWLGHHGRALQRGSMKKEGMKSAPACPSLLNCCCIVEASRSSYPPSLLSSNLNQLLTSFVLVPALPSSFLGTAATRDTFLSMLLAACLMSLMVLLAHELKVLFMLQLLVVQLRLQLLDLVLKFMEQVGRCDEHEVALFSINLRAKGWALRAGTAELVLKPGGHSNIPWG